MVRLIEGHYFNIKIKHYYFFPGIIAFGFTENPFFLDASVEPNLLESLVLNSADEEKRKSIKRDKNIRRLSVPLFLVKEVESAIKRKDHTSFFAYLWKIEKYGK